MTDPCMSCGEDRHLAAPRRCRQPAAHSDVADAVFARLRAIRLARPTPALVPVEERRRLQALRLAERHLTIPDGRQCFTCRKEAHGGFIKHARGCPERRGR